MQKMLDYANIVINSGKYALQPNFASNFLPTADGGIENGVESIWSIQFSKNHLLRYVLFLKKKWQLKVMPITLTW